MALYSASRKYIAALHHKSPPIRDKYGWKVFLEEVLDYQEAVLIPRCNNQGLTEVLQWLR